MARKMKKISWLYIALGAVVGLGALMGVSRLFFKDEGVDRSELGVNIKKYETNVEGYEIMLAYDDAEKILNICRTAMEDSTLSLIETGYTYEFKAHYVTTNEGSVEDYYISIAYDYSENPENDQFTVVYINSEDENLTIYARGKKIYRDEQKMILPRFTNYEENDVGLYLADTNSYKLGFGYNTTGATDEDVLYDEQNSTYHLTCMPDEIINLVRLVDPLKAQ